MTKKSSIYTRTGDKGTTALIGNSRVPKFDDRIEAYGTLDELKSYLGLLYDLLEIPDLKAEMLDIINYIFVAESHIASETEDFLRRMPEFKSDWIQLLEIRIDKMDEELPELKSFVLPCGNSTSSHIHIARTICRRAERSLIRCSKNYFTEDIIIQFINRLSDYLFVLARYILHKNGQNDIIWKTN